MVLECCVAVVRIRPEALSQLEKIKSQQKQQNFEQDEFFGPSDFDILMSVPPPPLFECGPCSSSQIFIEHQTVELPRCWPLPGERAADAALRFVGDLDNHFLTKAVQIPPSRSDHLERPGSSISLPSLLLTPLQQPPPLLFIPIIPSKSPFPIRPGLEFCPFATVLHAAMNYDSSLVEPLSQNLLVRIGEWLSSGQCKSGSGFLHSLFLMPTSSAKRTLLHSVLSNETNGSSLRLASCQRTISLEKENEGEGISHQKIERISSINIELKMETFQNRIKHQERLDNNEQLFVNPLFGIDIPTKRREAAPEYFVRGKRRYIAPKRQRRSTDYSISNKGMQQRSPTEFWEQQHPLHKYAYDGNAEKIRDLLKQGLDPNELDYDFWTPLHYCAFYNRLEACQVLLLHPDMDVNIINRTGATPLHFAALNGHVYIAELILSHQFADISIRDSNGKTPLDLCAPVPKPDWQGVAFLLRQSDVLRPTKMEVQLVGGPSLQVEVDDIDNITAGELRTKVLEMEGLKHQLAASAEQIFAIWLVDPRLSLQLTAEQKVQIHLNKWEENLNKFGSELKKEYLPERFEDERVRVVLKRDARTLLGDEQMLARKRPFIVSLLYGEAEDQFLKGMLPCHEKHYIPMAAIISQRLYGSELPQNVDFLFLSRILPSHLIPKTTEIKTFSSFLSKLKQARNSLTNLNLIQLQLRFLSLCWSLNVYGCTFFSAFMLMNKPIRGSIQVHVGLNDWGMSVLNSNSHRQIAAIELNKLEIKFTPNTNYLEVQGEGGCNATDFVATITTPQVKFFEISILGDNFICSLCPRLFGGSLPTSMMFPSDYDMFP